MISRKAIFLIYVFIVLCGCAYAQTLTMPFEMITEANGLSNHNVGAIIQDHDGYIWIGTGDGLDRFDGYSYKVFRKIPGDSNSIQRNYITSLAIEKSGKMWVGHSPNGLSCYDPLTEKFTSYRYKAGATDCIGESTVSLIYIDSKDNIWVSCVKDGFYKFNRKDGTFKKFPSLPGIDPAYTAPMKKSFNNVNRIYEDSTGLFWVTTSDGLYTFDPVTEKFHSIRAKPIIPYKWRDDGLGPIFYDNHDGLWLGSWGGGLQYYNMKSGVWKMFKYHPDNPESGTDNLIHDVKFKNDSELWVATGSFGLTVFNKRQEKYFYINQINQNGSALSSVPNCWYLFIDKWGNKWVILNDGLGFSRANSMLFNFSTLPVTRTDNGTHYATGYFYKDIKNKKLYIATEFADGLNVLNEENNELRHYEFKLRDDEGKYFVVPDLLNDSKGNLWICSRDNLYFFDKEKEKLVHTDQPPPDTSLKRGPFFQKLLEDDKHRIWIGTVRGGAYLYDPGKKTFRHFQHDEHNPASICSDNISDMTFDNQSRVWLTSPVDGISIYDDACNCFTNLRPEENDSTSIPNKVVTGVARNSKGEIWVASFGGISHAITGANGKISFRNYSVKDGLPSETSGEVACDKKDNVWFTTPAGLSRLDVVTNSISTFTDHEGLQKNYMQYDITVADDGEIIIGANDGYIRFYPDQLVKKQTPPVVIINSVKVFDKNIPFRQSLAQDKQINFTWKDNFFSFEFAALNFSEPEKNQFAYMLAGFDENWIECGNRRYASYTNLSGGDYIFKVKASNGDGTWNSNIVTVPIHIEPPYWKKTWFLLLTVIITSLLLCTMYLYRVRQIRHTEELKTNFNRQLAQVEMRALRAQMNPHFIFNCLNSINRYIVKSDTKTASLYLTKFSRLIRLILENSESSTVLLAIEMESLKLYIEMESLRFENKFTYEINAGKNLMNENILIPPLIVQPYVENAIWHGLLNKESAGKLRVDVNKTHGSLQFVIEDNGVGRAKAKELRSKTATERKSLGMKLTEERIAILNEHASEKSTVRIEDLKDENGNGCGTRVVITFHQENHHQSRRAVSENNFDRKN